MAELSGALPGIGLLPLLRFLSGLRASGRLRLTRDQWMGDLYFEEGAVLAAFFGEERGLGAVAAIVLALPGAQFSFTDAAPPDERNVHVTPAELEDYVDRLVADHASLAEVPLAPAAVPRVVVPPDTPASPQSVPLTRSALRTLLAIDGRRSVAEIAGEHGLVPTLVDLTPLLDHDLICIDPPAAPSPVPEAPQPQSVALPVADGRPHAPPSDTPTPDTPVTAAAVPAEESELRFWLRPIVLAIMAAALLGATWRCSAVTGGVPASAPAPGPLASAAVAAPAPAK